MTELFFSYGHPATEELPEHFVRMEPTPQRIRAVLDGVALADSRRVLIMHESGRAPAYYFPMDDVRMDLMESTTNATT